MPHPAPLWLLVMLQAVVSAASLVVEIVAGRMLAPYVGASLYTWTSVIAVVLAGFSAGHWWGGRIAGHETGPALKQTGLALLGAALTTAGAAWLLSASAGHVLNAVQHPVWGIAVLTVLVFFLPSLFAGVPAPVLTQVSIRAGGDSGRALGAMFAAGALGAIGGTLLAGFLFISWLGTAATLAVVTVAYLLAAGLCLVLARSASPVALLLALATILLGAKTLALPNACTVESRYFCLKTVDISADPEKPVRLMVVDHLGHGISARDLPRVMFTDHAAMLDALARLRAPSNDFSSFHIGGGTYSVPRSLADRGLTRITVAEIDPAVTRLAADSFWFDPATADIRHVDARVALRGDPTRYDVIIGDAFTDVAVPAHLVTRDFFELVRDRLTEDGSYLMNVIDYEGRLHVLAALVATLREVFPEVEVWTEARRPEPGERMVFVLAAGYGPTRADSFRVPSPDLTQFSAVGSKAIDRLVAEKGLILTDDFAPIDRLVGRPD